MTTTTTEAGQDAAQDRLPAIDPRFRARLVAVRRQEGRKRLRRLGRLTALLGLVVVGWLVTRSPLLDVDEIRITGAEHATAEAVLDVSGIDRGDPMTDLDSGTTARRIEALPWVAAATVRRKWPATVEIAVTERTAVAVLAGGDGRWWVIARDGEVLEPAPAPPPGLVVLAGMPATTEIEPGSEVTVSPALEVAALLPSGLRSVVRAVEVGEDEAGDLWLLVGEEGRVRLGAAEQLSAKLLAVATLVGQVEADCVATLDVRVPTAPVLTRAAHCA